MKGIILAGGKGSRLSPLTDITNKFLMPVYDRLMIEYSVQSLADAGIKDIAIVLGTKSAGETMDYLKSGAKYGVKFTYLYQDEPLGAAHALLQAKDFAGSEEVIVLCADNVLYDDLAPFIDSYYRNAKFVALPGAFITVKAFFEKDILKRFAVLEFENHKLTKIVEKPNEPKSNFAFCGVQIYDNQVWSILEGLKPSERGEYELTHVLNEYIKRDRFSYTTLIKPWFDCGTKDSLFEAQEYAFYKSNTDLSPCRVV